MQDILSLLNQVYSKKQSDQLINGIDSLLSVYKPKIDSRSFKLDQTDVLMICYGDQVSNSGQTKLETLRQFSQKYLKRINLIHILPFYPYSSDDGFSVIDYLEVNPDLGSWQDVERMSADYGLMFDGVINHISQESRWLEGFLNNDPKYQGFFTEVDPNDDFSQVTRPRTSPVFHEFKDHRGDSRYLWTTFSKDQVDLNYKAPELFLKVLEVLLFYVSKGAQMIRLDAIGFIWKRMGTTCIHLEEAHLLIQAMRLVLERVQPDIMLVSETNVPHKENVTYFGNGYNEAKMVYNFTLPPLLAFSLLDESSEKFSQWVGSLELPSDEVCFFNFTASHDGVGLRPVQGILDADEIKVLTDSVTANRGFISYKSNPDGSESPYELNCNYKNLLKGIDGQFGLERFILSQAVMMSMPGLPAFYFHSLVGSENFTEGVKQTGRYRTINREKLTLNELEYALEDSESDRRQVLDQLQILIKIRSELLPFNPFGEFEVLPLEDGLFGLKRYSLDGSETITCLFNFTSHSIANPLQGWFDHITKSDAASQLAPYEFLWLSEHTSQNE